MTLLVKGHVGKHVIRLVFLDILQVLHMLDISFKSPELNYRKIYTLINVCYGQITDYCSRPVY